MYSTHRTTKVSDTAVVVSIDCKSCCWRALKHLKMYGDNFAKGREDESLLCVNTAFLFAWFKKARSKMQKSATSQVEGFNCSISDGCFNFVAHVNGTVGNIAGAVKGYLASVLPSATMFKAHLKSLGHDGNVYEATKWYYNSAKTFCEQLGDDKWESKMEKVKYKTSKGEVKERSQLKKGMKMNSSYTVAIVGRFGGGKTFPGSLKVRMSDVVTKVGIYWGKAGEMIAIKSKQIKVKGSARPLMVAKPNPMDPKYRRISISNSVVGHYAKAFIRDTGISYMGNANRIFAKYSKISSTAVATYLSSVNTKFKKDKTITAKLLYMASGCASAGALNRGLASPSVLISGINAALK